MPHADMLRVSAPMHIWEAHAHHSDSKVLDTRFLPTLTAHVGYFDIANRLHDVEFTFKPEVHTVHKLDST